jgi:hypothetical protein
MPMLFVVVKPLDLERSGNNLHTQGSATGRTNPPPRQEDESLCADNYIDSIGEPILAQRREDVDVRAIPPRALVCTTNDMRGKAYSYLDFGSVLIR